MNLVKEVISQHRDEFENFEYYFKILELIETNLETHPDIAIESSKALFEGVSKTMLKSLNPSISTHQLEDMSIQQLIKALINELKRHIEIEELNYISVFAKEIGVVRNLRGEISHGRLSPKEIVSEINFAYMIANTTDVFVNYLLEIFFNLKKDVNEKYTYDSYNEFNEWLDSQDQAGFFKSYSFALYETDYIRYEQELLNFYPELE